MSLLIKGMEMPKNCVECPLVVCLSVKSDCPLVPVPPHGRLIDADACAEYFENQAQDEWNKNVVTTWSNAYLDLGAYIEEDAPTIIPAEEGENVHR